MAGKCPGCGNVITSVSAEHVDVTRGFEAKFHGVSFVCPNFACQRVLSVAVDPLALKNDIVKEVLRGLGKP
jgi:hypothetical protein